jgi:hypothetical protein
MCLLLLSSEYGNNHASVLISPFPYAVKSVHTHFGRPCHLAGYAPALHNDPPPSPHLHDGDDDDTAHSASQCRDPSQTPSQMNLHLMTRRTALVYGRYNRLGQTPPQHVPISRAQYVLLDFFLPSPSLSTTASSHATRGPSR